MSEFDQSASPAFTTNVVMPNITSITDHQNQDKNESSMFNKGMFFLELQSFIFITKFSVPFLIYMEYFILQIVVLDNIECCKKIKGRLLTLL